jgi:hypothetical protein
MKTDIKNEVEKFDSYVEQKIQREIKDVHNKWNKMGTKQKLDTIFVVMGIIAFTTNALVSIKKLRN